MDLPRRQVLAAVLAILESAEERLGHSSEPSQTEIVRTCASTTSAPMTTGIEVDPEIKLADYIETHWLPQIKKRIEPTTFRSYSADIRNNFPDELKALPLRSIKRGQLKRVLTGLEGKLAPATVAGVANVMRSIFGAAVEDEIIAANPALKIGQALGLRAFHVENIKAMTEAQLQTFLAVAREREPAHYVELATLAFTGMRIGELRGLQQPDVDLAARSITISRQVHEDGRITGPKGRRGRRKTRSVDLADDLAFTLEMLLLGRKEYDTRMGRNSLWLLYPDFEEQPTSGQVSTVTHRLRRAMRRVLVQAKLPLHFTPHALRHSFATNLLARGEDAIYVARQLGDTLAICVELYGRHAKVKSRFGGPNLLSSRRT